MNIHAKNEQYHDSETHRPKVVIINYQPAELLLELVLLAEIPAISCTTRCNSCDVGVEPGNRPHRHPSLYVYKYIYTLYVDYKQLTTRELEVVMDWCLTLL